MSFVQAIDDRISPIVVKELRQAVKSRLVTAVLLLFLLVELLVMGAFLLMNSIDGNLQQSNSQIGREVFLTLQAIMVGTCMLVIPAYAGIRLASERSDTDVDLLFVTTLAPRSIISGKLVAALMIAVLIFGACAPFMTFTYFLRGIDLPSIFVIIALDFLAVLFAVLLAMFVAVIPATRVLKALLGLGAVVGLIYLFAGTIAMSAGLLEMGVSILWDQPEATWGVLCGLLAFLGVCSLLFVWSVAFVNPPTANRALPMRVMILAYWLVSGLAFCYAAYTLHTEWPLVAWAISWAVSLSLCLSVAVNERERWSLRVARTIPRWRLLRVPAFLLYSGSAGGTILYSLLLGVTAVIVAFWESPTTPFGGRFGREPLEVALDVVLLMYLYTYAYALTAVLVRRTIFPKLATHFTWVIMLIVFAVASVVPLVILLLINQGQIWRSDSMFEWLLPNGVAVLMTLWNRQEEQRTIAYLCVGGWCALVTLLNLRWYLGQMAAFAAHVPRLPAAPVLDVLVEADPVDSVDHAASIEALRDAP